MTEFTGVITVVFVVWVIVERIYVAMIRLSPNQYKNATVYEKVNPDDKIKTFFMATLALFIGFLLSWQTDVRLLASLNFTSTNEWIDIIFTAIFFALGPKSWRTIVKFVEENTLSGNTSDPNDPGQGQGSSAK